MPLHPKLLRLSDGAYRLWSNGLHFANRAVTDGRIDKGLLASLNHHGRWTSKQIGGFVAELSGGLWIDRGDHFEIHDYAHHQAEAMKDRVERRRGHERDKKRRQRETRDGAPPNVPPNVPQGHTAATRREVSVPSRPDPTRESANALFAREAETVVPRHVRRFEESFRPKPAAQPDQISMSDVEAEFHAQRKAAGGGAYKNPRHRDDEHLEPIADSANAAGDDRESRLAALRDTVAGFLVDPGARAAGCPIAWLARDPGRYLAARRAPPAGPVAACLSPERSALAKAQEAYNMDPHSPDALEALKRARRALLAAEVPA